MYGFAVLLRGPASQAESCEGCDFSLALLWRGGHTFGACAAVAVVFGAEHRELWPKVSRIASDNDVGGAEAGGCGVSGAMETAKRSYVSVCGF